jgi:hypothetical protein
MDWRIYYWLWIAVASLVTLILFGLDKNVQKAKAGGFLKVPYFYGY